MSRAPGKKAAEKLAAQPAVGGLAPQDITHMLMGFDVLRLPPGLDSLDVWVQGKLAPMVEHLGGFTDAVEAVSSGQAGPEGNPVKALLTLRMSGTMLAIEGAKELRASGQDFQQAERVARDMAMCLTGFVQGFARGREFQTWEADRTKGKRRSKKDDEILQCVMTYLRDRKVRGGAQPSKETVALEVAQKKADSARAAPDQKGVKKPSMDEYIRGWGPSTIEALLAREYPGDRWPPELRTDN